MGSSGATGLALSTGTFSGEVTAQDFKATGLTGVVAASRYVGATTTGAPATGTFLVGDYVITHNGQMFVCVVAGTPGTWVNPRSTQNLVTTGEETFDRDWMTSSGGITMTSGTIRFTFFTARRSETSTQVRVSTGGTAAASTPTLCRVGLYLLDAAGDGTLVASIVNDTALFAATSTAYTRSWSTPYAKVAGARYALAALVVTGAAAPILTGSVLASSAEAAVAPRLSAILTAQTDLVASFTNAGLTATTTRVYGVVLP